jgi:histidine ammonia-lyase
MTLDGLKGTPRAFDPRIHAIRPHPGQRASAANLSRLLEGSEIRQSHITCRRVQDAYSLRCAPQVHGAVRDALAEARRIFEIEINSVTDNPLVVGTRSCRAATSTDSRWPSRWTISRSHSPRSPEFPSGASIDW